MAEAMMGYRYGFSQQRALALLQMYSARSHVSLRDAAREFVAKQGSADLIRESERGIADHGSGGSGHWV